MKELIIIQHCQSEHHVNGMSGGWTDTPLTKLGREQAKHIGERLSIEINGDEYVMYSSDLLRASQTADIIAEYLDIKVNLYPKLRERNFGIATGKSREWLRSNLLSVSQIDRLDHRPVEGAETWREFYTRIANGLNEIQKDDSEKVIIVSHGGALNNIIAWWLKIPIDVLNNCRFKGKPGAITKLNIDDNNFRVLSNLSDDIHLRN